jgi:hypothetical protein
MCKIAAVLFILQFLFDILGYRLWFSFKVHYANDSYVAACHSNTAYEHWLYTGTSRVAVDQIYLYLSFSVLLELRMFRVCRRMKRGKLMCASMVVILNRVIYVEPWKRLMFH